MRKNYQEVFGKRYKNHPFLISDFSSRKRESIIVDLVEKIKSLYGENLNVEYAKIYDKKKKKSFVNGANISNEEKTLKGKIRHWESSSGYLEVNGSISALIKTSEREKCDDLSGILDSLKFNKIV